ncbi:protein adenylyltransferase SelO family protein [Sphingomicrobium astaxanthinifaciens]|uniref:protein adenylyltransferase SelO family protein n=1 Tax=Sphingomicrobium astaxanthinifaciens TaxID=1227949 RepID=UPI001FCB9956|nr:YdiU family protein [Sphingomicrobium astaxanthinifaciens]MCJ7420668.1 YdiU family protein [Sphingomicrobium astaxanthinifaciens]
MDQTPAYTPDPRILELGPDFYDEVAPAEFPEAKLRFANHRWAKAIGLGQFMRPQWEKHFARFEPLPRNLPRPLALRYHGHQFRSYNPDLGDGRGFLFAQLRDGDGRLLDLGTKGSGQTPYSRLGDGRLTLKGGVREIFATEMLEALGVNTSKSFALFETGEALWRSDEPSPTRSSVLTRLGHGHIRIGTFQRYAFHRDKPAIAALTRYCLEHLYGETPPEQDKDAAVRLFDLVSGATARLAASYMAAGFVHGVLNSDNIAITGESFDYGPWRFAPYWNPRFTAAYFDGEGLYSFARQPEAIQWDLAQLGGCLGLLTSERKLNPILNDWGRRFDEATIELLLARLGIRPGHQDDDRELAKRLVAALATETVTIDRVFFDWRGGRRRDDKRYESEEFLALAKALEGRENEAALAHPYWSGEAPCSMHIEEVEARWAAIAERDDWKPFEAKITEIRHMGEAMAVSVE